MKFIIIGKNIEVTPGLKAAVEDKIGKLEKYFNPLRFSRNCVNQSASTAEEMKSLIRAEYVREFVGEGQLFFYYKRNGLQTIPDGATASGTMNVQLTDYVFPLPDSETSQRAESQDNVSQE